MTATLAATWTELSSSQELQRSSHSVASVDGKIYVFGGELHARQPRDNDVFALEASQQSGPAQLKFLEAGGLKPTPRVGATMTALHDKLYIFSGRGGVAMAPLDESGALQVFSIKDSSWSTITPADSSAALPEARSYHCAATDGKSRIFIHAGCPEKGRLRDLWSFDIDSRVWTQLEDAPGSPRGGSSITYADSKLWRMNGFDGEAEIGGTLDIFDIESNAWSTFEFSADGKMGPGARSVSSLLATDVGGKTHLVTMFGEADPSSLGHAGAGKMLNDAWAFDTQDKAWKRLESKASMPKPRGWFDASAVGPARIAVTGGLADSNERIADAWSLTISA